MQNALTPLPADALSAVPASSEALGGASVPPALLPEAVLPEAVLSDPARIRAAVNETLARPEFPPELEAPVRSFFERLGEWLQTMFAGISLWSAANPVPAWIVFCILLLLLIAIIVHLIYTLSGGFNLGVKAARRTSPASWEILEGEGRSWAEGLMRAREALERGEHRRALWIAHRVLLGLLDERGLIHFAGHKTNQVYLQECERTAAPYPLLQALTELYEQAVYAAYPVSPENIGQQLQAVQQLSQEAPRGA
ncbi:MAG: DUF4129 domain-containing protein [Myxococcota bacterium]